MNIRVFFRIFIIVALTVLCYCIIDTEAGDHHNKKKIIIHVPVHKKIEKHIHTIVKHVHHHHKPIVMKEEKIIHEEHHPIIKNEHISHEHLHHHHENHEHHEEENEPIHIDEEEEHVHHHHNYEYIHKGDESIEESHGH